jgi:hypothetical protein
VALERLVVAGETLLAPRIDVSGVWRDSGHRNASALLAELEGIAPGHARATLEVGRRLEQLPGTEEVLRHGALSAPKVAELTGAGVLDPNRETDLLSGAPDEPFQRVRERCQRSRATSATKDPVDTVRKIRADRHFSWWTDPDGAFCYQGRDTADRGAALRTHVGSMATRLGRIGRTEDGPPPEPERALRADALFALVTGHRPDPTGAVVDGCSTRDGFLHDGGNGSGGDEPAGGRRGEQDRAPGGGSAAGHRSGPIDPGQVPEGDPDPDVDPELSGPPGGDGDRPLDPSSDSLHLIDRPPTCSVVVRVDLAALLRGKALPGELCEIDGQGPVPVRMARSMADDSFLRFVFHEAGDIRSVSHFGRTINRHLRTALVHRDTTCVVPGCGVAFGLEIDHIVPFAEHGPTTLDNLALLCHHHHFLKTYEGWDLARAGTRPDGTPEWSFCPPVPFGQEPGLGIDTPEGRRDLHQDE